MILLWLWSAFIISSHSCISALQTMQHTFSDDSLWRLELSDTWDVLGPFPIQAREQAYLSPSFPLNLSEPVDLSKKWPSSYADGGEVSWSTVQSDAEGHLDVSFPKIRWANLRATEGWAALQHHAVLRSILTVHPPSTTKTPAPGVLVDLVQGSYFALVPYDEPSSAAPRWYSGNIYDLERSLPQSLALGSLTSLQRPTKFFLYVAGDYEIRLFGDPLVNGEQTPVQKLRIRVALDSASPVSVVESHNVVPDFVDGWAFGTTLGVGLRVVDEWWTVVHVESSLPELEFALPRTSFRIAPTQTRIFPLDMKQQGPVTADELEICLTLQSQSGPIVKSSVFIKLKHVQFSTTTSPIKSSYLFASDMPTMFYAIPPTEPFSPEGKPTPPLLATHGAGVDIFATTLWQDALPRQKRSWIVVPSGRTSWGLDWHGPSAQDAWCSLDALAEVLNSPSKSLVTWKFEHGARAVLVGHSNGGQGAWWIAERYPNRVIAVVPAAGYMKSQAYVSLAMSRSAHFVDPILRAVLESSLTPDDDDLFATNLHGVPVLAIHGGNDENVPTWHSREAVSVVKSWYPHANISYIEDDGGTHYYSGILDRKEVQAFLDAMFEAEHTAPGNVLQDGQSCILTVAIPSESGSMYGFSIRELHTAGRLGRLQITKRDQGIYIKTSNIARLAWLGSVPAFELLQINGEQVQTDKLGEQDFVVPKDPAASVESMEPSSPQHSGRIQSILTTNGTIQIAIPSNEEHALSIALRIAHDLDTYHKLDAEIMTHADAQIRQDSGVLGSGNLILIGTPDEPFIREVLRKTMTPVRTTKGHDTISINGMSWNEPSLGALFLHPHLDLGRSHSLTAILLGCDGFALERMTRLVAPFRTGVPVPDWIVTGPQTDYMGAGGVLGAGFWNHGWSWNPEMSFMSWVR